MFAILTLLVRYGRRVAAADVPGRPRDPDREARAVDQPHREVLRGPPEPRQHRGHEGAGNRAAAAPAFVVNVQSRGENCWLFGGFVLHAVHWHRRGRRTSSSGAFIRPRAILVCGRSRKGWRPRGIEMRGRTAGLGETTGGRVEPCPGVLE